MHALCGAALKRRNKYDNHYKIAKTVSGGKTYTSVSPLDHEGRRNELARIIGGVEITKATLDYAEEMLSQSTVNQ